MNNVNYWMRLQGGRRILHAAPIFHIADFPAMFAAPRRRLPDHASFQRVKLLRGRRQERDFLYSSGPDLINLLLQFVENNPRDLSSLRYLVMEDRQWRRSLSVGLEGFCLTAKLVSICLSEQDFSRPADNDTRMITSLRATLPRFEVQVTTSQATHRDR